MNNPVRKIELTAPAGGWKQLVAAVNAGADSVYLGYKKFGARAYAENFNMSQLKKAVDFSHRNSIKVYLTLNTLIKDREVPDVIDFLSEYTGICSDGIIVQDYGIYKIIKDLFEEIPVHASTQMNIHNLHSLKLLKKLGFKRVILAREMTLSEIKNLCADNLPEIEVFGHGSQCYSYSGNCYFSSFVGGRSGNRGRCSQPCRMKYRLAERDKSKIKYIISEGSYLFSKSDLCVLDMIPSVISAGVDALKIEGRMKSPEYVGIVTKIYRKYIDLYYRKPLDYKVDDEDYYKLSQIFSRDLGPGYLRENYPKDIISIKKSGSIGNFIGRVYKVDHNDGKRNRMVKSVIIKSNRKINKGDIIEVWTKKGNSRINVRSLTLTREERNRYEYRIDLNKKIDISKKDRVFKYFDRKLDDEAKGLFEGSSNVYRFKNKKNSIKTGSRAGYKRIKSYKDEFIMAGNTTDKKNKNSRLTLAVCLYDCKHIGAAVREGAEHVIYSDFDEITNSLGPGSENINILKRYNKLKNIKVTINTPFVMYNGDLEVFKNNILKFTDLKINSFAVSNPGLIKLLSKINQKKKSNIDLYMNFNFNLFNSSSILFFKNIITGNIILRGVELSPELNIGEISKLISNCKKMNTGELEFSIFGYGYFPVMNSRYKLKLLTGGSKSRCFVEDLKGYRFPAGSHYNENIMIYNSKKICTLFDLEKIYKSGIDNIIIDTRFFKEKDFLKIIKIYREAIDTLQNKGGKEYKDFVLFLKDDLLFKNYSKGHLLRGIE